MKMTHNKEYLFVYGTLRRGGGAPLSKLLGQQADLVGLGTFQGKLYDLGYYPGVVPLQIRLTPLLGKFTRSTLITPSCHSWMRMRIINLTSLNNPSICANLFRLG